MMAARISLKRNNYLCDTMSDIQDAIKQIRENSKERKFTQSVEIAINLKGLDLKKPDNKFKEDIVLPNGRGNPSKVAVIGEELVSKSKGIADVFITGDDLSKIEKDKNKSKNLVDNIDFFIAEPAFMARIGKSLGRVMGPRNKMPQPLPPQADPKPLVERFKKTTRVALKDSPVIHCLVGGEKMNDAELEANIVYAINAITSKLANKQHNIRSIYLKMTMGPAVRIR